MIKELPRFCKTIDQIIREIAAKKGEDPEEFKQWLLEKIQRGCKKEVDTADTASTQKSTGGGEHK